MSNLLFLLVLASVPIQLGKFIFLEHSFVLGLPVDYRAVSIYFSDLAILLFLVSAVWQNRKSLGKIAKTFKVYSLAFAVFIAYLFFSSSDKASYFFVSRILVLGLFSVFAANILQDKRLQARSLIVLSFSVLWQSILIAAQFINQGSVGARILGERTFDASTVAIAH